MLLKKSKKTMTDNKRKLVTKWDPKSPVSEQYRTIRTNIQFSSVDKEIRSIMVTSTGPSEGKSTTVANVAVVFAQQGKKVLVVDADLRKPTVHYTFEIPNTFGLTNVLTKRIQLGEAIKETDITNLYVLTCGPIPPNPSELLVSKSMQEALQNMLDQFDVVIFDTPPVLAVTDAQIISNLCDGTVLVIASGKTEIELSKKAKEVLEAANGTLLGVVLNMKKQQKNEDYYYYYGGK